MTKPRTTEQWLALGNELPTELAKVFTPEGEWKHEFYMHSTDPSDVCSKCHCGEDTVNELCPVPDPIKIDWNTAKEWFRKVDRSRAWDEMWCMFKLSKYGTKVSFAWWLQFICKSKHCLIAAAIAVERNKE